MDNYYATYGPTYQAQTYRCAEGYCLQQEDPESSGDQYCARNRKGTMCAECVEGCSLNVATFECTTQVCTTQEYFHAELLSLAAICGIIISLCAHWRSIYSSFKELLGCNGCHD